MSWAAIFMLSLLPLLAQGPPAGAPPVRNFGFVDLGMVPQVWSFAPGPEQHIFVGLNDGLVLFDGLNWRSMNTEMPFYSLCSSGEEDLFYISENSVGQLIPAKEGQLKTQLLLESSVDSEFAISPGINNCLFHQSSAFFSTHKSIYRLSTTENNAFNDLREWREPSGRYLRLFELDSILYIQHTELGLLQYQEGDWRMLEGTEELGEMVGIASPVSPELLLLVGSDGRLHEFDLKKKELQKDVAQIQLGNPIISFETVGDGLYAVAVPGEGVKLINADGTILRDFNRTTDLSDEFVRSIHLDHSGFLWVGSDNALSLTWLRAPTGRWDAALGLTNQVLSLYSATDTCIYIGTVSQILKKENNQLKKVSGASAYCKDWVTVKSFAGELQVIAACNNKLVRIQGLESQPISDIEIESATTLSTSPNHPQLLFVGTGKGLILLESQIGGWESKTEIEQLEGEQIEKICISKKDRIWIKLPENRIATGLLKLNDGVWGIKDFQFLEVPSRFGKVNDMCSWRGRAIIGSDSGFIRYLPRSKEWHIDPLFSKYPFQIMELHPHSESDLWAITLNPSSKSLLKFKIQDGKQLQIEGEPFPLPKESNYTDLIALQNDIALVASSEGMMEVEYARIGKLDYDFKTIISEVRNLNDSLLFTSPYFSTTNANGKHLRSVDQKEGFIPEIDHRSNGINFLLSSSKFLDPKSMRYSFFLEGFDKEWSQWQKSNERQFTNLPGGIYTLKAKSMDRLNNEGRETSFIFKVSTPWYKSVEAYVAYGLLSLLLASLILSAWDRRSDRKLRRMKKDQQDQEEFTKKLIQTQEDERQRIASDLHDEVGQRLIFIKNAIDMIPKIKTEEKKELAFDKISEGVDVAIDQVRQVSRGLRPYQLNVLGITEAIEQMGEQVQSSSGLQVVLNCDNIDNCLSREEDINLYRIVQESMNNVMKHGQATIVKISLKKKLLPSKEIMMEIQDNGVGFDSDTPAKGKKLHFGLHGITSRTKALGGTFRIYSAIGKGTTLRFWIPWGIHNGKDHS